MTIIRRALCWVIGHKRFYYKEYDPQSGYLNSCELSCARCGRFIDVWSWRK